MTEQLLIAKVHVFIQVRQVKGVQYRYRRQLRQHHHSQDTTLAILYQNLHVVGHFVEILVKDGQGGQGGDLARVVLT